MKAIEENTVKAAGQTNGFARISWIGDKGKRVLIFGNSITRHPPAPDFGWLLDCGMAASCAEKDYVHLLYNRFRTSGEVCFCIFQASDFECTLSEREIMPELAEAEKFGADLKSFFEAATLEGANKFQKIRFVTIPTILPTIALMLVNSLTYLFTAGLEQFMAMYESPTRYSQYVIDTLMYDKTMQSAGNYPVATALGLMNGVIALVLMLGGNAFVKKKLHTSLW